MTATSRAVRRESRNGQTTTSETHGIRQLAVLATVAACLALATLLIGAVMAGLAGMQYGFVIVLASLMFVGVALFSGWVPGLYLGLLMLGVGAIVAGDGDELQLDSSHRPGHSDLGRT